jgi:hypothetical protein
MATTNNKDFCVYAHYKKNTDIIIYIGKGLKYRANSRCGRNILWERIVAKYDYSVKIIKDNLTNEEACELEKTLIKKYGRINNKTGILCNMTDGGEGISGWRHTDETKEKMSKSHKGKVFSDKTLKKFSEAKMGDKNHKSKIIINTQTGVFYNTVTEAANSLGWKRTRLQAQLDGQNKNNTYLKFI